MKTYKAPNGLEIIGTLETLTARAEIVGINDNGEPEYSGHTEVFWDEQRTVTKDEKYVFLDYDGNEWTFDQLVPENEVEEATP